MLTDSIETVQHSLYKIQPKVRVETPVGAIEADTGSHIIDGLLVVAVILVLYLGKKVVDKLLKGK